MKEMFLKISQNFQEKICGGISFLIKWQAYILQLYLKEDSNTSVFCEFYDIFKNSCSYRTSPVAASVYFLSLFFSTPDNSCHKLTFNDIIWICYSVSFYSIAFIANPSSTAKAWVDPVLW